MENFEKIILPNREAMFGKEGTLIRKASLFQDLRTLPLDEIYVNAEGGTVVDHLAEAFEHGQNRDWLVKKVNELAQVKSEYSLYDAQAKAGFVALVEALGLPLEGKLYDAVKQAYLDAAILPPEKTDNVAMNVSDCVAGLQKLNVPDDEILGYLARSLKPRATKMHVWAALEVTGNYLARTAEGKKQLNQVLDEIVAKDKPGPGGSDELPISEVYHTFGKETIVKLAQEALENNKMPGRGDIPLAFTNHFGNMRDDIHKTLKIEMLRLSLDGLGGQGGNMGYGRYFNDAKKSYQEMLAKK